VWNTVHKDRIVKELLLYNEDRTKCFTKVAPKLREFLDMMLKDQENWQHEYSLMLMCHSMGNYILRIVAQLRRVHAQGDIDPRGDVFENVFMVAADVREDIFDERLNDYDPKIYPTLEMMGPLSSLGNVTSNTSFTGLVPTY
jgi:esterase/lipase superfamily enzyme